MKYLAMPTFDIRTNLATEQYLMSKKDIELPLVLFYIQKPCIIIGRNQNTLEEIDQQYCRDKNIVVTRRLSGGGAMYDDLGNLSFSFIVKADKQRFGDFKTMVAPIVTALHRLGVTGAVVTGRNDIVVDGKKFSGNAMYTRAGRTFSHGTLMLDVDMNEVAKALNVPKDKIQSKGIKSVRSRVTNLRPYLAEKYKKITTEEFRDFIIRSILGAESMSAAEKSAYHLTLDDQAEIKKLEQKYYRNWDWVYGHSPRFTLKKRYHFASGTIDARVLVENGKIKNIRFLGDYFGTRDVTNLEKLLVGQPFEPSKIMKILAANDINSYFQGLNARQIADLLFTL
ncbi:lipoate-protein ligase [Liquorilactobacillus aquaticus DSM 21051]|uniref:lipoate--protein ligase n=1 Tax=Liquorilactobacillus aquaticus DSM 21051 TaxID=1423725 RepID=A0A0R2CY58_9LACO|nr:lipoate--protein ligase [Liquorilactobacillus aquaticus]KRM96927.1 lipoate-protein ligase [Liquorilactobacillus aquaticus DSM 21051]